MVDNVLYLVDGTTLIVRPRTPLVTVDGTQIAVLVGPFVPDADLVVVQILDIGVAAEEPQQFVDDTLQMEFLGGQQGESVIEVVARLGSEDADGTSACTVAFLCGSDGKWVVLMRQGLG